MTTTSRTGRRHGRCAARSGPTFPTPAICCWCAPAQEPDEDFLRTLAYSLRRAIQLDYQIEEQEIQVELIGSEKQRRIILWEAAEGGIGVWERLIEEPGAFAGLARTALGLLHFDPARGDESRNGPRNALRLVTTVS